MVEAILVTIFGFFCSTCIATPFGIAAIVNAANVNSRYKSGDYEGAERASKQAKTWTIVTGVICLVIFVLIVLIYGTAIIMALQEGDF